VARCRNVEKCGRGNRRMEGCVHESCWQTDREVEAVMRRSGEARRERLKKFCLHLSLAAVTVSPFFLSCSSLDHSPWAPCRRVSYALCRFRRKSSARLNNLRSKLCVYSVRQLSIYFDKYVSLLYGLGLHISYAGLKTRAWLRHS
jgi:hypothetical protein